LVNGNVGGEFAAATPTRCTFTGGIPPATNAAAALALTDFASAYTSLKGKPCTQGALGTADTIPASMTLLPGTYCTGAALAATGVTLTLDAQNNPDAVWIFQIGAALTGTNFTVTMANGAGVQRVLGTGRRHDHDDFGAQREHRRGWPRWVHHLDRWNAGWSGLGESRGDDD
jgi:hypothetical protein